VKTYIACTFEVHMCK